ncbi:EamA family transporter, partial [Streptomyces sp. NPDC058612]
MVSVALGAVVLGEALGPRVLAGMAVVLVGVAMSRHEPAGPPRGPAAPPARAAAEDVTGARVRTSRRVRAPARGPEHERVG